MTNPSFSEYDTLLSPGPERIYRKLKPCQAYHASNHPSILFSRTLTHTSNQSIQAHLIRHPFRNPSSRNPSSPHAITHTAYIIPQTSASGSETVAQISPTRKASKQTTNQAATWRSPPLLNPPRSLTFPSFQNTTPKRSTRLPNSLSSAPWFHYSPTQRYSCCGISQGS